MNTDTLTTTPDPTMPGATQIGWVPYHWLEADLRAAEARPTTRAIFVLGHKLLVRPDGKDKRGDVLNDALNAKVTHLFDASPKVKGYFTSHDHLWDARKLPGGRGVWQIVSGNGGSELDHAWTEPHPYFGFTVTRIYESGRVTVTPYKRPVPTPYDAKVTEPGRPGDEMTVAGAGE
jgi:hypothetical protein